MSAFSVLRSFKHCVPRPVRRTLRDALQELTFNRAMRRLAALPPGIPPDRSLLAAVREGWGNDGFVADLDYLQAVAQRAVGVNGRCSSAGAG